MVFQRMLFHLSQGHATGCFNNLPGTQKQSLVQFNLLTQM